MWHNSLDQVFIDGISLYKSILAIPTRSQDVAITTASRIEVQACLNFDVIKLGEQNFFHLVDRTTRWSKLRPLSNCKLFKQVCNFKCVQLFRHDCPTSEQFDGKYNIGAFASFCKKMNIDLVCMLAYWHESNGAVERANRTLRSYFDHLHLFNKRAPVVEISLKATYGLNINRGSHIASAFELMLNRAPTISGSENRPFNSAFCPGVMQENNIPSPRTCSSHWAHARPKDALSTTLWTNCSFR